MARKVVDITNSANSYDILSQTPKNYSKDNYFLKELQDKVNAEWRYRPNRVDIEYENSWGVQTYTPIEVVIQSVRSEKGSAISNDCRRIVFKNILEDRFVIGSKFKFSEKYDLNTEDKNKNVWLATNTDNVKMTSSMIIERCNGTLGSVYVDNQGITQYHYEPVIQGKDLSAVNLFYNEVAVSPQSQLLVIAQHNEFTKKYYINQRFIVGYDKVYRIKAINKFYANSTNDPENVGLMRIYLELTESCIYDNFDTRIAYQNSPGVHLTTIKDSSYSIKLSKPEYIPVNLTDDPITFTMVVVNERGQEFPEINISVDCVLENLPSGADQSNYFDYIDNGNNSFDLRRKRIYLNGNLQINCKVNKEESPSGEEFSTSFTMVMGSFE